MSKKYTYDAKSIICFDKRHCFDQGAIDALSKPVELSNTAAYKPYSLTSTSMSIQDPNAANKGYYEYEP